MSALLKDLVQEFGRKSRLFGAVGGRYLYEKICDEQRRLAEGWTYEPPTFYDANDAALALPHSGHPLRHAQHVTPHSAQRSPSAGDHASRLGPASPKAANSACRAVAATALLETSGVTGPVEAGGVEVIVSVEPEFTEPPPE